MHSLDVSQEGRVCCHKALSGLVCEGGKAGVNAGVDDYGRGEEL